MKHLEARQKIIDTIKATLIDLEYVYAAWLEGSDGLNRVDEYSDIDICVDVDDDKVQEVFGIVEGKLNEISRIDFIHEVDCGNPKIIQKYYRLENTSEYLIIDFAVQLR